MEELKEGKILKCEFLILTGIVAVFGCSAATASVIQNNAFEENLDQ